MLDAFQHGADIHAATAAKIFKVPLSEVRVSNAAEQKQPTLV
jgi:DNA polymerase I-like protein with 3'-5' exonuclease and polymerase domains